MAEQGRWRRRLLELVVAVPLTLLAILAVYSLASLTDVSLADLSAPVVASVVVAVLLVVVLGRWLYTRRAKRRLVMHAAANFTAPEVRAAAWPQKKVTPPPARPTLTATVSSAPGPARVATVASKWGTASSPSVSRGPRMIVSGTAPEFVRADAPNVVAADTPEVVGPVIVPALPVAPAPVSAPPSPRAAEPARRAREAQREREVVSAVRSPGESSALAEYMHGREELATLIASVEARLPGAPQSAVVSTPAPVVAPRVEPELHVAPEPVAPEPVAPEPAPVVEVVSESVPEPVAREIAPEPEPEPVAVTVAVAVAAPGAEPANDSAARNAQVLSEAVEKVTRASELIAESCALFTETVDADRAELRALADAVMTLAQAIVPPPATPRLVGGNVFAGPTRAREHDIVIDDDRSDASVSAPASASVPTEKSASGAPRPAAPTPRPSSWSAAQTTSPPTSIQPKPRFPGNRSES